jgi:Uma2 family endonuclease
MSVAETGLMTVVQFEQLPTPPSGHYELHHGQPELRPPRKKSHMRVQQVLFDMLSPVLSPLGFLTVEFAFRPEPEHEVWQADIGWVVESRWRADEDDYFLGAPNLVIEVLSPSNTVDEILDKQEICFRNGCEVFWTVDPKRRAVLVTMPDRSTVTYSGSIELPVHHTNWRIGIERIFPA